MGTTERWFKDLIACKRDGGAVGEGDWRRWVGALVAGELPDYQVAAFLMAVFFRGMDAEETAALTSALAASGEQVVLGPGPYVDKHSTGGVGDNVTLVAVPWAAACGARIAKLSGRGLGHTGGTLDKLGAIPGIQFRLSAGRLKDLADAVGWAVAEAYTIAPADKIIYELRDATATVESTPLIVASILSKKIAGGAPAFVIDVKTGRGAFATEEARAVELADALVAAAREAGRRAVAVITGMDQPLGKAVGNALEVEEAVSTLRGEGPADLLEVAGAIAAEMLVLAGVAEREQADALLGESLASGAAYGKFEAMIRAQGGAGDWEERLPRAEKTAEVKAAREGYVVTLDARAVAGAANVLGAGRARRDDQIDPAVGVTLRRKRGEQVTAGDVIMTLHYNDEGRLEPARRLAEAAIKIGDEKPTPEPLLKRVIR